MNFFYNYYNNIIKYDLVNKFKYQELGKVPKFLKVILIFKIKESNTKNLATSLLALELMSQKKGLFLISRKTNVFLKIRKGYPIGCKLILIKRPMHNFLTRLTFEVFSRFKVSISVNKKGLNYGDSLSYRLKNSLLFLELEKNYNIFNTILTDLSLTIVTNKTNSKELKFLLYSFKQFIKFTSK